MHPIYFYKDRSGKEPVKEYIAALAARNDKDSRIKLKKYVTISNTSANRACRRGNPMSNTSVEKFGSSDPPVTVFCLLRGMDRVLSYFTTLENKPRKPRREKSPRRNGI